MRNPHFSSIAAVTLILVAGCIVSDELTTITIQPDGSADWTRFRSNIRSTEKGEKGAQELKKVVDEFDAREDADLARIVEAGGEVLEARWVRREEPYANLVIAKLPTASSLEKFCTIKGEKGEVLAQARFTQIGNRRKLSMTIPVPRDEQPTAKAPPTFKELREQFANSISETRLIVAGGQVIASQGFMLAGDKRSCLVDAAQIEELLRQRPDHIELFLEWELTKR